MSQKRLDLLFMTLFIYGFPYSIKNFIKLFPRYNTDCRVEKVKGSDDGQGSGRGQAHTIHKPGQEV